MTSSKLLAACFATALVAAPTSVAFAEPAPVAQTTTVSATPTSTPASADAEAYAAREAKDTPVREFRGGGEVLVVGASSLTIFVLVLALVILL